MTNRLLDKRYAHSFIISIYEHEEVSISALIGEVCKNYNTLTDLKDHFVEEGLVNFKQQHKPKRKYTLELTPKGEELAEKLLEIEEM